MKTNTTTKNNEAIRFLSIYDEVQDIKSDLAVKENILNNTMYRAWIKCANPDYFEIKIDSIVSLSDGSQYKIIDVDLEVDVVESERVLVPFVYLTRVKKGTEEIIKNIPSHGNPKAYSKKVEVRQIKEVIKH